MVNYAPVVSICIPTYNAGRHFYKALHSILNQTYRNIRVHVVDNASTDQTVSIAESFDDSRLYIHRHDTFVSAEENFTRCIPIAEGKYTAIFHGDDVYDKEIIKKQVMFMETNPTAGAVFTHARLIDHNDREIGQIAWPKNVIGDKVTFDFKDIFKGILKYSNFLITPSAMVRTSIYKNEIKFWDECTDKSAADLGVWLRIVRNHEIGLLAENLINYRISAEQYSANLRARTELSDMFLVLKVYLAQEDVQQMLDAQDRLNYNRLLKADSVVRAMNLYILGDVVKVHDLCIDIFTKESILAVFSGKRGVYTFALGVLLRALIACKWHKLGVFMLLTLKRITHK